MSAFDRATNVDGNKKVFNYAKKTNSQNEQLITIASLNEDKIDKKEKWTKKRLSVQQTYVIN